MMSKMLNCRNILFYFMQRAIHPLIEFNIKPLGWFCGNLQNINTHMGIINSINALDGKNYFRCCNTRIHKKILKESLKIFQIFDFNSKM